MLVRRPGKRADLLPLGGRSGRAIAADEPARAEDDGGIREHSHG